MYDDQPDQNANGKKDVKVKLEEFPVHKPASKSKDGTSRACPEAGGECKCNPDVGTVKCDTQGDGQNPHHVSNKEKVRVALEKLGGGA